MTIQRAVNKQIELCLKYDRYICGVYCFDKCDRCGKELNNEVIYKVNLPHTDTEMVFGGNRLLKKIKHRHLDLVSRDLCEDCMEELADWMENG